MIFESTTTTYRCTDYKHFRVGTVRGLWRATDEAYEILAVKNEEKGNGHFKETLRWFEQSCKRDNKKLRFVFCINPFFAYKCIKHGYTWKPLLDFEKRFV